MAPLALAHSLMLDFHCLIAPRFVYAVQSDFSADALASDAVRRRIADLCRSTTALADALADSNWGEAPGP